MYKLDTENIIVSEYNSIEFNIKLIIKLYYKYYINIYYMKTIKLKIMNSIDLNYELKTYNSVVHFAYNRFHDDVSIKEKDVRYQVNQIFKGK